MDSLFYVPLAGGLLTALMAGPLGTFILWKRMAFLGDTLAHSVLLGVSVSLFLNLPLEVGIIAVACLISFFIASFNNKKVGTDTLLAIASQGGLALGLIGLYFFPQAQLTTFLLGDILSLGKNDLPLLGGTCLGVLTGFYFLWTPLLKSALDPELAALESKKALKYEMLFTLLIAIVIAFTIKIVGILLVTALLIMPAAISRLFSSSPKSMSLKASLVAVVAVALGFYLSYRYDLPTGALIVAVLLFLFLLTKFLFQRR